MTAFPEIQKIAFEGPDSTNPLAFRHYNPDELVEGKPMKEHLRFAVAYWHTFRGQGADPFGPGCAVRPWEGPRITSKMLRIACESPSNSWKSWASSFIVFTIATWRRKEARWPSRIKILTKSPRFSSKSKSGPASSFSGARRICLAIVASCTERPQAVMPMSMRSVRPKSRKRWK